MMLSNVLLKMHSRQQNQTWPVSVSFQMYGPRLFLMADIHALFTDNFEIPDKLPINIPRKNFDRQQYFDVLDVEEEMNQKLRELT